MIFRQGNCLNPLITILCNNWGKVEHKHNLILISAFRNRQFPEVLNIWHFIVAVIPIPAEGLVNHLLPFSVVPLVSCEGPNVCPVSVVQIRELEPLLCRAGHVSRVVWTSSSNARRSAFNIDDIQHRRGTEPYSSSKFASDLLSLALNRHKNSQVCLLMSVWCLCSRSFFLCTGDGQLLWCTVTVPCCGFLTSVCH